MAEYIARGIPRILNTPLLGLLRTSFIPNPPSNCPYLGGNSRAQLTDISLTCRYKSNGSLHLGNSTQRKTNNGELYGALQIGKSSKKLKSKRKNPYGSIPSLSSQLNQNHEAVTFKQQTKSQSKKNPSTIKTTMENKVFPTPSSNTATRVPGSFLSSLRNQPGYTNHMNKQSGITSTATGVKGGRSTTSILAGQATAKNKLDTLLNNGMAASLDQTSRDWSVGVNKTKGKSSSIGTSGNVDELENNTIDEFYRGNNVKMDNKRREERLEEFDPYLEKSTNRIPGEDNWNSQRFNVELPLLSSLNQKSARDARDKKLGRLDETVRGSSEVRDRQHKSETSSSALPSMDYEHILYNEKRHQNMDRNSCDICYGKNSSKGKTPQDVSTTYANPKMRELKSFRANTEKEEATLAMPQTRSNELSNGFILVEANEKVPKVNKTLAMPQTRSNELSNGFILVEEANEKVPKVNKKSIKGEQKPSKQFRNDVDEMIEHLRIERWEKLVQKNLKNVREKSQPTSFVLINEKSISAGKNKKDQLNSQICDDHVFLDPRDQVENYVFGSTSSTLRQEGAPSINVSHVPNNTARIASQVNIRELKPELSKKSASSVVKNTMPQIQNNKREITKSKSEPVLCVQPGEISKKNQQGSDLENMNKTRLTSRSYTDIPDFSSKDKTSNLHSVSLRKELIEAVENTQKGGSKSGVKKKRLSSKKGKNNDGSATSKELDLKKANRKKKDKKLKDVIADIDYNQSMSNTKPSNSLTTTRNDASALVRNVGKVIPMSKGNEKTDLLNELREQWKADFKQGFLEMQKERLVKEKQNAHKIKSTLMHTPNSIATWVADTQENNKLIDIGSSPKRTENFKDIANKSEQKYRNQSVNGTKKIRQFKHSELPIRHVSDQEKQVQNKKGSLKDALYQESSSTSVINKTEHKKRKNSDYKRNSNEEIYSSLSDKKLEEFCRMKDELLYDEVLVNRGSLPTGTTKGLLPMLEKMDGFMTMELIPVIDYQSKQRPGTSSGLKSTPQKSLLNDETAGQQFDMVKNYDSFEKDQLARNMMALRRYQDRQHRDKGDKKKKKKATTKRKNGEKGQRGTTRSSKSS